MSYGLRNASEIQKRRLLHRRMFLVNGLLLVFVLTIVARLVELQIVRGQEYHEAAQRLHYGDVEIPAKRGDILGINSKTGEYNIFATNVTLDLVYVDPDGVDNPNLIANTLSETLLTPEFHAACTAGAGTCPKELIPFYAQAFDPLIGHRLRQSGSLLEPLPDGKIPSSLLQLPNLVQSRDLFARNIESRISEKYVTFAPLKYGATKTEMRAVQELHIPGVIIVPEQALIYASPQDINQSLIDSFSRKLATALNGDAAVLRRALRSRPLRYVPVMRKLPPALSRKVMELKTASAKEEYEKQQKARKAGAELKYPLRSIAIISEHWRHYPDTTVASHVVGFLNPSGEPQYGIERTLNAQLRGQKGSIRAVSDLHGGQILRPEQSIDVPKDGDTVVLTLDRAVQKQVEALLADAVDRYRAESAQAIVMDPYTGRIIAMANAPLFNSNSYTAVNEKEPVRIDSEGRKRILVEIFEPVTNALVVKAEYPQVFTSSGRALLPDKMRTGLRDLEKQYDIRDLVRYYILVGQSIRREVFPTEDPNIWLKFRNNLGIGAYLNRTDQEIYEPGSVLKAVTMAIAFDQGERTPTDTYNDTGVVHVDEYKIDNNDHKHYGLVTMTNCIEYSINTCMTDISFRLGAKLFHGTLARFGFGQITGIDPENELPGTLKPWGRWARSELATVAFGQGIAVTPLQMITAFSALGNGGKLMRPILVDSILHEDGTVEKTEPRMVDQVITPETSRTITAVLVSSASKGFAKAGKPQGYRIAGKTGTSQIARGNKWEVGTGSTIASYAGFAPVDRPRFAVLVKIDRPKNSIHGATAAAPVFKDIMAFLFQYYDIPPDEK
jgi:cell division protein FtsI/penicillin-binding protein 2